MARVPPPPPTHTHAWRRLGIIPPAHRIVCVQIIRRIFRSCVSPYVYGDVVLSFLTRCSGHKLLCWSGMAKYSVLIAWRHLGEVQVRIVAVLPVRSKLATVGDPPGMEVERMGRRATTTAVVATASGLKPENRRTTQTSRFLNKRCHAEPSCPLQCRI